MKEQPILKAEAASSDLLLTAMAAGQILKARVSAFTRKDGAFVVEHDDKRMAKKPDAGLADVNKEAAANNIPDEQNHELCLNHLDSQHVAAAARGDHDLNKAAKAELASRGLDSAGKWVGFAESAKHHGVDPKSSTSGPVAEHMKTLHPDVLAASASGRLDLNAHAKKAAAARGIDKNGKWVGFDKAKAIHLGAAKDDQ